MDPTPLQSIDIRTNDDLVNAVITARQALDECNADKAALRQWSEVK